MSKSGYNKLLPIILASVMKYKGLWEPYKNYNTKFDYMSGKNKKYNKHKKNSKKRK